MARSGEPGPAPPTRRTAVTLAVGVAMTAELAAAQSVAWRPNATAVKFGYPRTLVAETAHWVVLVRPDQPTLGSLVLVCKDVARALPEISAEAFADLKGVTARIEAALRSFVRYDRINYLMLMMIDPDVHYHVLPRYEGERTFEGAAFHDAGWPGPPQLNPAVKLSSEQSEAMVRRLKTLWE